MLTEQSTVSEEGNTVHKLPSIQYSALKSLNRFLNVSHQAQSSELLQILTFYCFIHWRLAHQGAEE